MTYLIANFEDGSPNGFRPVNLAASVTMNVLQNIPQNPARNAQSGTRYLTAFTKNPGGSVAVDFQFPNSDVSGHTFFVSAFAWVRCQVGSVDGQMTFWGDLNPANNNNPNVLFRAEKNWKLLNNATTVTIGGNLFGTASKTIRLEFYINTTETNLDIDTVAIV